MITITRWRPDTCGCDISYEWDTALPADQRVHILTSIIKCVTHNALSDSVAYDTVLNSENRRKNKVVGRLSSFLNIESDQINHRFEVDRSLKIRVPPANRTAAQTLHTEFDTDYGIGKVRVE